MTDIAGERRKLAGQDLSIRYREAWGATFDYTTTRAVDLPANDFFLHIAVVTDPGDLLGTEDEVARKIERIGISRFPNTGISYNALAFNTGRLYEAQPLTRRGAHTVNDKRLVTCPAHGGSLTTSHGGDARWNLNITVRALCLPQMVGDSVTDVQVHAAAKWAAAQIRAGLARSTARWHGHRCVASKDCPGAIGYARIAELDRLTDHYTQVGLNPPEDDMPLTEAEMDKVADKVIERLMATQTWYVGRNGKPVSVRGSFVSAAWLADHYGEGGEFEEQLDRIEAESKEDNPEDPKA